MYSPDRQWHYARLVEQKRIEQAEADKQQKKG